MPLPRKPDWPSLLHGYLMDHARAKFAYGTFDCCRFAGGAIEAMTGQRLGAVFDGVYTTRRQAFDAVKAYCGKPSVAALAEKFAAEYGIAEIPVKLAQRGDVVLHGASLGIVAMHGTEFLAVNANGLWRVPLAKASRAWRI
jgi:hypothetical protein